MKLNSPQRERLARGLAKQLPSWGERQEVASRLGLADEQLSGAAVQCWRLLIQECEERGMLERFLRIVGGMTRDPSLRLAAWAASRGRVVLLPRYALHVAGVVAIALGVALVGVVWIGPGKDAAPDPGGEVQPDEAPAASLPAEPSSVVAATPEPTKAQPAEPAEPAGVPGTEEASPQAPSTAAPPQDPPQASDRAGTAGGPGGGAAGGASGPCPGTGRIGYAYAGESEPRVRGGVWTVASGVYVRTDRPRRENGWSSKKRVVCTLSTGDRVALAEPPEFVEGGAWWVPIHGGSVRR